MAGKPAIANQSKTSVNKVASSPKIAFSKPNNSSATAPRLKNGVNKVK